MTVGRITEYLSERATDPAPAFIMQREIFKTAADDPAYVDAYERLKQTKYYTELANEQQPDGSWGRFHTQNSKDPVKRRFVTTEHALQRARQMGLPKDDPVMVKAIGLMERYVTETETWTDSVEKHHDNGKSHMRARPFLTAAVLNQTDPGNPAVKPKQDVYVRTLAASVSGDTIDEAAWDAENRAYRGPCLNAWNAYSALMLSNADADDTLQRLYLRYLWDRRDGIYYISNASVNNVCCIEDRSFGMWLGVLEYLIKYPQFVEFAQPTVIPHLLYEAERLMDGRAEVSKSYGVRYADNWRDGGKRTSDVLLRILRLLVGC